jgi:hypothetical protein
VSVQDTYDTIYFIVVQELTAQEIHDAVKVERERLEIKRMHIAELNNSIYEYLKGKEK